MNTTRIALLFFALTATFLDRPVAAAVVSVTQNTVPNLDPIPPQIEATPLGEESFALVDRNHELTSAPYVTATGVLTTASDASTT
jgi:hypothetical protein